MFLEIFNGLSWMRKNCKRIFSGYALLQAIRLLASEESSPPEHSVSGGGAEVERRVLFDMFLLSEEVFCLFHDNTA